MNKLPAPLVKACLLGGLVALALPAAAKPPTRAAPVAVAPAKALSSSARTPPPARATPATQKAEAKPITGHSATLELFGSFLAVTEALSVDLPTPSTRASVMPSLGEGLKAAKETMRQVTSAEGADLVPVAEQPLKNLSGAATHLFGLMGGVEPQP